MEGIQWGAFMETERTRLRGERETLVVQRGEIDNKIGELDRELLAIDAYESTKAGKGVSTTTSNSNRRGRRASSGGTRRGSKRDALLKVIREGNGMTRAQILDKMALKGDKQGEMSVSNALTALVKKNEIRRDGRKYLAA